MVDYPISKQIKTPILQLSMIEPDKGTLQQNYQITLYRARFQAAYRGRNNQLMSETFVCCDSE